MGTYRFSEQAVHDLDEICASRAAAAGEAHTAIDRAIAQLPPDYAQVIRDLDLAGKSVDEVASAMGRSKGAVHMLRARA
ncbi:MAG: hypothetical protein F6K09_23750, partial [Merismopedia sp. SIO2A8]|nr:hypothetical protein [Merismopedia sp. SIO2A8]